MGGNIVTKKEFKIMARKVFEKHGFITEGKLYCLDLPDVFIAARLAIVYNEF